MACRRKWRPVQNKRCKRSVIGSFDGAAAGAQVQLLNPKGVLTDPQGFIYVSDKTGGKIVGFDGSFLFELQFGQIGGGDVQFQAPLGMALDSQRRIYVAEQTNQRVQKVDNGGTYFGEVGGTAGSGDGQFQGPLDVAIDGSDNIYVVDSGNHRIQVFDPGLNFLTVIGGLGSGDGQFNFPIALDVSGNFLYVADAGNFRIQKFDISNVGSSGGSNGISFADEWGTPGTGNGQFASPRAMAVDGNGDLWVVDRDNARFQVFAPDGTFKVLYNTPGPLPHGIAYSTFESSMWHTDRTTKLLYRIDASDGTVQGTHASGEFTTPGRIAIEQGNLIYVGDQGSFNVRFFDFNGNPEGTFGGFGSDPGKFGQLSPGGMALDSGNNLIISDFGMSRIQKRDRNTGTFTTSTGSIPQPVDAAVDGNDRIFIVDSTHKIHVLDNNLNLLESFGEQGSGDGQFSSPEGIAVIGNFAYVSDTGNNRIVKLDITNAGSGGGGGDPPSISINDVTDAEDQTPFNFSVTLSASSTQTVTVDYVSTVVIARDEVAGGGTVGNPGPSTDFLKVTGTLTFNPGDTQKSIPVTIIDDATVESTELFYVNLSNATNATISDTQADGSIQDNDVAPPAAKLTIENAFGSPGEQAVVNILIEGTNDVAGVQFDVDTQINGTNTNQSSFLGGINGLDNAFSLNTATADANPRVLFFSNSNSTIQMDANNKRVIMQLVYDIDGNTTPGTVIDLDITDHILSDANSQVIPHQLMAGQILIGQPGDVAGGSQGGGDGEINILDIVAGIQAVLGIVPTPQPGTIEHFALDMKADGVINVLDIVAMINAVLNQGNTVKAVAAIPAQTATIQLGEVATFDDGRMAVPVQLNADGAVAAMEASFTFDPSMLTLGTPYLDEGTAHMTLDTHVEDGVLRVVVYSFIGGQIPSNTQVMLWMPVALGDDARGAAILNMGEVVLADRLAESVAIISPAGSVTIKPTPTTFSLQPNHPNPFNPSTAISYEVSQRTHVTLAIYNVLGQEIIRLVDKVQPAGRYTINWNARTAHGHSVASGIYLYRLNTGSGFSQAMRMTLLK